MVCVCVTVIHSAHCSEEFPVSTLVDPSDGHDYEVQSYSSTHNHVTMRYMYSHIVLIISLDYEVHVHVQSYSTNEVH